MHYGWKRIYKQRRIHNKSNKQIISDIKRDNLIFSNRRTKKPIAKKTAK